MTNKILIPLQSPILIPLQSFVSCFLKPPPPQTGRRQWAQLKDYGAATPQHVPKAPSAEPP